MRLAYFVCLTFATAFTAPAYAYLDPATGSIILQGLIAGIAGMLIALRVFWGNVKAFFRQLTGSQDQKDSGGPDTSS